MLQLCLPWSTHDTNPHAWLRSSCAKSSGRRCFPAEEAARDGWPCPRHSPIDLGLTDSQLLHYSMRSPAGEKDATPAPTGKVAGNRKEYQPPAPPTVTGAPPAAPTRPEALRAAPTGPGAPTCATTQHLSEDLREEVARLWGEVAALKLSRTQLRSEVDELKKECRHLLELYRGKASQSAAGPPHEPTLSC
jgi:hypothetical protein